MIGRSEVVEGKWCKAVGSPEEIEIHSHDGDGEVTTIAKFTYEKNYLDIDPIGPQGLHPITLNGELLIVAIEPPKEDMEESEDENMTRFRIEIP